MADNKKTPATLLDEAGRPRRRSGARLLSSARGHLRPRCPTVNNFQVLGVPATCLTGA